MQLPKNLPDEFDVGPGRVCAFKALRHTRRRRLRSRDESESFTIWYESRALASYYYKYARRWARPGIFEEIWFAAKQMRQEGRFQMWLIFFFMGRE